MSYSGSPANLTSPNGTLYGWIKVEKTYSDFSVAAKTNSVTVYTLPVGGILLAVKMKTSAAFSGGGATYVDMRLGISGSYNYEKGYFDPGMDLMLAVADDSFNYTAVQKATSYGATAAVIATVDSDVNLNTLADGAVGFWFLIASAV